MRFLQATLDAFSELGSKARVAVRRKVQQLLLDSQSIIYKHPGPEILVYRRSDIQMHLPFQIQGFTDSMCSLEHVTNVRHGLVDELLEPNGNPAGSWIPAGSPYLSIYPSSFVS